MEFTATANVIAEDIRVYTRLLSNQDLGIMEYPGILSQLVNRVEGYLGKDTIMDCYHVLLTYDFTKDELDTLNTMCAGMRFNYAMMA